MFAMVGTLLSFFHEKKICFVYLLGFFWSTFNHKKHTVGQNGENNEGLEISTIRVKE